MARVFLTSILTPVLTAQAAAARLGVRDAGNTSALAEFAVIAGVGVLRFGDGSTVIDWTLARTGAGVAALGSGNKLQQNAPPTTGDDLVNKTYADLRLALAGGTMTGFLGVSALRFTAANQTANAGLGTTSAVHQQCASGGGAFTLTLPSAPSTGQLFIIEDSIGSCAANPVTIARNGNTIGGAAADLVLNVARGAFAIMYDGVGDWKILSRPELKSALQPASSDLAAIAALAPTNDDVIQRKAGAWVNRTMAQLAADLGVSSSSVVIPHTFGVGGLIQVPVGDVDYIPPFFVSVPAGHTAKLCAVKSVVHAGTSVTFSVQINGVDATGFTGIAATTTAATTDPTDIALADGDMVAIVVTAIVGTPRNLSASLFVEYT